MPVCWRQDITHQRQSCRLLQTRVVYTLQHSYALFQRGVYDAEHDAACCEIEAKYYQVHLRITPSMVRSTLHALHTSC